MRSTPEGLEKDGFVTVHPAVGVAPSSIALEAREVHLHGVTDRDQAARIGRLHHGFSLEPGRHEVGYSAPTNRYWRDGAGRLNCAHGVLLYGTNCLRCERGEAPGFAHPVEERIGHPVHALEAVYVDDEQIYPPAGLHEFPGAVPAALLPWVQGFCLSVMDGRPPSQRIGRTGNPYIDRWFLGRKVTVPERSLPPGFEDCAPYIPSEIENLYLHAYHRGDADEPHDHPWPNASCVVRGWYRENLYDAQARLLRTVTRRAGDIVLRSAGSIHAILETSDDCLSLFATLRKERDWGFWTADGFVPWRQFDGGGMA